MRARRRGFSLLEIVISLFLLSAVVIMVLNLYPSTLLGMHHNRNRTQAELQASSALAQVRQSTFDDMPIGLDKILSKTKVEGVEYTTRLQVLKATRGDPDRLRVIRITTSWDDKHQVTRELWIPRASR